MFDIVHADVASARPPFAGGLLDPLGADSPADFPYVTTERRLQRLAIAAADVGARFARDGIAHDAGAWMMAPRRMFDGRMPLEACQDLDGFLRSTLLHGLGFGLDAGAEEFDTLIEAARVEEESPLNDGGHGQPENWLDGAPRFFSCIVEGRAGRSGWLQAFCAIVETDEARARARLRNRFGDALAAAADVFEGFDATRPLVQLLLSEPLKRALVRAALDPEDGAGRTLDVQVEQRIGA